MTYFSLFIPSHSNCFKCLIFLIISISHAEDPNFGFCLFSISISLNTFCCIYASYLSLNIGPLCLILNLVHASFQCIFQYFQMHFLNNITAAIFIYYSSNLALYGSSLLDFFLFRSGALKYIMSTFCYRVVHL